MMHWVFLNEVKSHKCYDAMIRKNVSFIELWVKDLYLLWKYWSALVLHFICVKKSKKSAFVPSEQMFNSCFVKSDFLNNMITSNVFWLIVFTLILTTSNWFYSMIIKYISDKPLGKQSVFDVVSRDSLRVIQIFGSVYCSIAIMSR